MPQYLRIRSRFATCRAAAAIIGFAALATLAALGAATGPTLAATLQLSQGRAARGGAALFVGPPGAGLAGAAVAVGDFDGDGVEDLAIGVPQANAAGRLEAGAVYVELGPFSPGVHVLGAGGSREIVVLGAAPGERAGIAVANAGNVTGDGHDSLVVGAYEAGNQGRPAAGSAYVIYDRGAGSVDLASLGGGGFRIDGAAPQDNAGRAVTGLPMAGGGGLSAVVVGAPGADPLGRHNAGAVYIVRPVAPGAVVDLGALAGVGTEIDGASADDLTGWSVANAGDVTGSGGSDLAIGAPGASLNRGTVSVALNPGAAQFPEIDLNAPAIRTLEVTGNQIGGLLGWSVAGVGDLTGNGLSDVAAGAWSAAPNGHVHAGAVDVIFGTRATRAKPPSFSYLTLAGTHSNAEAGRAVAGAPALTAARRATLLIGASGRLDANYARAGAAYALFGVGSARASRPLLPPLTLQGSGSFARTGDALAAGANLLGDGRPAIVVGAPAGAGLRGQVYVVPDPLAIGLHVALPTRDLCPLLHERRMPVRVSNRGGGHISVAVTVGGLGSPQRSFSVRRSGERFLSVGLPVGVGAGSELVTVTADAFASRRGAPVTHVNATRTVSCQVGGQPPVVSPRSLSAFAPWSRQTSPLTPNTGRLAGLNDR